MKPTSALYELQKDFLEAILTGSTSGTTFEKTKLAIAEKAPLSSLERLKIYQDGYCIRLSNSLQEDFPRVKQQLGEDEFTLLIEKFIRIQPPSSFNLAEYSEGFPRFLKNQSLPNSEMLFELGMQDWHEILARRAQDPKPHTCLTLTEAEAGIAFRLRLHPATHFFIGANGAYLTFRQQGLIKYFLLSNEECKLIEYLTAPRTIEDLTDFCEKQPELQALTEIKLTAWLTNGVIYCERIQYGS